MINFVILLAAWNSIRCNWRPSWWAIWQEACPLPPAEEYQEAMFEPPATSEAEELPSASESEDADSSESEDYGTSEEELPSASEAEEPLSETPSEEPYFINATGRIVHTFS